ncbi:ABC transporter substrate-binding protein [Allosalinactinospora lopnorensis]|uniref:ABC transporter substrate-binding protein n=1 Tax=Allosalinactinospora lopnorensis TaxID=1352348 RepID=UPI000623EC48|nr:ABC transporter substrate-binding protein [Allosalinactinospora lopnorensis]
MRIPTRLTAAGFPVLLVLSACAGTDPYSSEDEGSGGDQSRIVVGSADFPESTLIAEIYAQALEAEGEQVETHLNIGSREVYWEQVEDGSLSVFPEYNGAILYHLDPESEVGTTEETNERVREALPEELEILDSAPAQSKDSVTVTRETAEQHDLETIADLTDVAGEMVIGGPPEFETRAQGLPGLESTYGVEFEDFRSLEAGIIPEALDGDDIQAANVFTADASIAAYDFVPLEDPENLFGAQNVTPLVHSDDVSDTAREALNAVSAELSTEDLRELNERVGIDHEDADAVAADWLQSAGLD